MSMERLQPWHGSLRRKALWATAALVACAPAVATLASDAMAWGAGDFLLFGLMVLAAAGAIELAGRSGGSRLWWAGVSLAVLASFLLAWATLAVGFIGAEGQPANLLLACPPLLALSVGAAGRFAPCAMARAMRAAAGAQLLVGLGALAAGLPAPLDGTMAFTALWLGAAWLFGKTPVAG